MFGPSLEVAVRLEIERPGLRPAQQRWRWIAGRRYSAPQTMSGYSQNAE